jgi:hypothetical protein
MKKGGISANSRNIFNRENFAAPAAGNLEALTASGNSGPEFRNADVDASLSSGPSDFLL